MSDTQHKSCSHTGNNTHESWLFSRTGIVTVGVLGILGFLVYTGHSAHLLGLAPYLFLLACPLMHIFMHSGHSHHHGDKNLDHHAHGGGGCCGGTKDDEKPAEKHTNASNQSIQGDA